MLLLDGPLTLREFMTHEQLPLASVFREVLLFLTNRPDAVLFGAQAVNAYCETERMTQDVDILATDAAALAEELRGHLADKLGIAVRVREVIPGVGFRIYQIRKPKNRHLVAVRRVVVLPPAERKGGVSVLAPPGLIAMKVESLASRRRQPKGDTDRADLRRLLLAFPELQVEDGPVAERLRADRVSDEVMALWRELAREPIEPDSDDY